MKEFGTAALWELPAPSERLVGGDVVDPVAGVLVDTRLAHLDHPLDYLVPPELAQQAVVGAVVKVRLAGREYPGYVLERRNTTKHQGQLMAIRSVISGVPLLSPEVAALAREVADHYAGNMTDVLAAAIPPRHARTEKAFEETIPGEKIHPTEPVAGEWQVYPGGDALLRRLGAGQSPRAAWLALPGPATGKLPHWTKCLAQAAVATLGSGRSAILLAPTAEDVARLIAAVKEVVSPKLVAELRADLGVARRYREFLRIRSGEAEVVIGTRNAVFAPAANLGLIAIWDDGDDRLAEPHAPYHHAREVAVIRAVGEKCGLILAGFTRTVAAERLVTIGWAASLRAPRDLVRAKTPRVQVPAEPDLAAEGPSGRARFPALAHRAVQRALEEGPVLIQVPVKGWFAVVACTRCFTPAKCGNCGGPLAMDQQGNINCRWCQSRTSAFKCRECHGTVLRALRIGSERTAQELGRAFPKTPVTISGADSVLVRHVDDKPRLVVATAGAEPVAAGGYAAGVILDGAAVAGRPELWAPQEAMRRWFNAAALVRAQAPFLVLGHPGDVLGQAMVRWDPAGWAVRALEERTALRFPPAAVMAQLRARPTELQDFLAAAELEEDVEIIGPLQLTEELSQLLLRTPLTGGGALRREIQRVQAQRSAARRGRIRVDLDPDRLD